MLYSGVAGSEGIAIGRAYLFAEESAFVDKVQIGEKDIERELIKVEEGVRLSKTQLLELKEKVQKEFGEDKAAIFDAHVMMLEDPEFLALIKENVRNGKDNAANAVQKAVEFYVTVFGQIEDEYMRERAADIKDVGSRLMRNITGTAARGMHGVDSPVIVVANDLTPSDTALMDKRFVLGFATDIGGSTSHTAIMARSLGIPAVMGLGDISKGINNGDLVIVDGLEGKVIVNPSSGQEAEYRDKLLKYREHREKLEKLSQLPAVTVDGRKVELAGNIGSCEDIDNVLKNGGEGVGLFRTEFLYMNGTALPTEEEQYKEYMKAAEKLQGKPLIIRTLDIGGDKKLSYLPLQEELNPFLGHRAIRLCLDRIDIFKTQLRAILRASAAGNILIMFPMISGVGEVREAKKVLEESKAELVSEGLTFDENIKVGIMVEIPSAAMTADIIAKEVDFFSIGTNDLCQYTLAVDRMNEKVSRLYQPFHPGVLRLIKNVIDASHSCGKFTGMCGELAGDAKAAIILLGLGLDEFSMSPGSINIVKNIIRNISYEDAKRIAEHALTMETAEEILKYSQNAIAARSEIK